MQWSERTHQVITVAIFPLDPRKGYVGGILQPLLRANYLHLISTLCSVTSSWSREISHGGNHGANTTNQNLFFPESTGSRTQPAAGVILLHALARHSFPCKRGRDKQPRKSACPVTKQYLQRLLRGSHEWLLEVLYWSVGYCTFMFEKLLAMLGFFFWQNKDSKEWCLFW